MTGHGRAPVSIINWSCFITLILLFSTFDLLKTSIRSGGIFCCENFCTLGNILTMKGTCSRTRSRVKYLGAKVSYHLNIDSCFQLARIVTSRDVSIKERKRSREKSTKSVCTGCDKTLRKNQNGVLCSGCTGLFHLKCTAMNRKGLNSYRWNDTRLCFTCCMPQFTDSFFEDSENEEILSITSDDDSIPASLEWFSGNISSYYKH